jgi:hypothetical protein
MFESLYVLCMILAFIFGVPAFFLLLDLLIPVDSLLSARDYGSTTGKWTAHAVYRRVRPTAVTLTLTLTFVFFCFQLTPLAF